MNQELWACLLPRTNRAPLFGFCLQNSVLSGWTPVHLNRKAARSVPMGSNKKRKECFLRTQRRITRSGIEPGFSNLLITNRTLYQLIYRRRILELIIDLADRASSRSSGMWFDYRWCQTKIYKVSSYSFLI